MTMNWLLLFIPVTIGLEFLAPERHLIVFLASSFAILPLAAFMGRATEELAEQMGEGVGGFSTRPSATPLNSLSHSRRCVQACTTS
jgi:Ca2+/H+ antiporter